MTRYPRQVDRECPCCRSGGLNKIQMIDGGTLDLHQDLVACDRRRRYIIEHQLPTVFQQSDSFHASSPLVCPVGPGSASMRSAEAHSNPASSPKTRSRGRRRRETHGGARRDPPYSRRGLTIRISWRHPRPCAGG